MKNAERALECIKEKGKLLQVEMGDRSYCMGFYNEGFFCPYTDDMDALYVTKLGDPVKIIKLYKCNFDEFETRM